MPPAPVIRGLRDLGCPLNPLIGNPMPRRRRPWGEKFDENACHFDGQNVNRASPVGAFAAGESPYGCEDMSGNVWEWTSSRWADYPYPEGVQALREREDPDGDAPRVLRGGGFNYGPGASAAPSATAAIPTAAATASGFVWCCPHYLWTPDPLISDTLNQAPRLTAVTAPKGQGRRHGVSCEGAGPALEVPLRFPTH